ncbi:MAG: hypothetical protein KDD70_16380 [Bdellovibrionales bacterium]|nr:hypothetical protein [Bdellovibrionales bacterium]
MRFVVSLRITDFVCMKSIVSSLGVLVIISLFSFGLLSAEEGADFAAGSDVKAEVQDGASANIDDLSAEATFSSNMEQPNCRQVADGDGGLSCKVLNPCPVGMACNLWPFWTIGCSCQIKSPPSAAQCFGAGDQCGGTSCSDPLPSGVDPSLHTAALSRRFGGKLIRYSSRSRKVGATCDPATPYTFKACTCVPIGMRPRPDEYFTVPSHLVND